MQESIEMLCELGKIMLRKRFAVYLYLHWRFLGVTRERVCMLSSTLFGFCILALEI